MRQTAFIIGVALALVIASSGIGHQFHGASARLPQQPQRGYRGEDRGGDHHPAVAEGGAEITGCAAAREVPHTGRWSLGGGKAVGVVGERRARSGHASTAIGSMPLKMNQQPSETPWIERSTRSSPPGVTRRTMTISRARNGASIARCGTHVIRNRPAPDWMTTIAGWAVGSPAQMTVSIARGTTDRCPSVQPAPKFSLRRWEGQPTDYAPIKTVEPRQTPRRGG